MSRQTISVQDIEAIPGHVNQGLYEAGWRETAEPYYSKLLITAELYRFSMINKRTAMRQVRRYTTAMRRAIARGQADGQLVLQAA